MRVIPTLLAALATMPLVLAAQTATPAGCVAEGSAWFGAAYKAAKDSATRPGGKPADVSGLLAAEKARITTCAQQFHLATTTGPELLPLAALYSSVGMDSLAAAAVEKRLDEPDLSEVDRANALVAMVGAYTKPDTLVIARAEPYMAQLDAMSTAVTMQKLDAHNRLNGEYRYLDVNGRIRHHSLAIIALTRSMKALPISAARDAVGVRSYMILAAYSNLSEVYGDFGHADSALAILHQAVVDHPEISAADADNYLKSGLARYALIGQPSMPLEASHWLNAPAGTMTMAADGKVTVIEFTAHWCIPCRNSYPSMVSMADKFGRQGVQFVFATEFYGYVGTKRGLDQAGELVADQEYFGTEHGVHFPIAVADAPKTPKPGEAYVFNPNDTHYDVGGIPQTVVIDKNGTIRRILTGWDTGNAERLPALLTVLLKEKPARVTPP